MMIMMMIFISILACYMTFKIINDDKIAILMGKIVVFTFLIVSLFYLGILTSMTFLY